MITTNDNYNNNNATGINDNVTDNCTTKLGKPEEKRDASPRRAATPSVSAPFAAPPSRQFPFPGDQSSCSRGVALSSLGRLEASALNYQLDSEEERVGPQE